MVKNSLNNVARVRPFQTVRASRGCERSLQNKVTKAAEESESPPTISRGRAASLRIFSGPSRARMVGSNLAIGEKDENVVLEFRPNPAPDMLVACLWSRWSGSGEPDLLSFAAITDEPPPEVAAAGHNRCIVPIQAENLDALVTPN